jgi:hypothetical protein
MGPARGRRFLAPETAWKTGTWEGGGGRTEKCSISVDSPACSSYKHLPRRKRRRELRKGDGRRELGDVLAPADTVTWEGDGGVAEKSKISVDSPASTPYKHTPSTNSRNPDGKNPECRGKFPKGSVSENWIASRFEDCGFCVRENRNHSTLRVGVVPPDASTPAQRRAGSQIFYGEFDPGSERTLAAGLTHASRARKWLRPSVKRRTGE